ncbi:HAD-IA family hydrolase [Streptococcus cuniculipharyngis]|uniref:HAD-IA family hydrolase n=1 Tax=Streptococcus cuniculipharyngis TaxID=1562651 RepID=A0A5C5SD39_9STRE|nr:HAD-IA family hydrolase [Streptococcus cuniculipharyngis]TWS99007.1 HAD-IA family hydrolase [Streptococcus cuniculipharyngis]
MTTNFIWDFDGTLVDSYEAIMEAMAVLYDHYQLPFEAESIRQTILTTSTGHLFDQLVADYGLDGQDLREFFTREQEKRDDRIVLLPHVREALQFTKDKGIRNFIYTHKGKTTQQVLDNLGIASDFVEVVTAANGFERKPHPAAINYLLDKYGLDKASTYYIGDRLIDVQVAKQAGIRSINLNLPTDDVNQKIESLADLANLFQNS